MERYQNIKQVQKATKSCQKRYANIKKYKVCRGKYTSASNIKLHHFPAVAFSEKSTSKQY